MLEKLFAIILIYHTVRVPTLYRHEPEDTRQTRLHVIAQSIVEECTENPIPGWPFRACVTLATTIPQWESGFVEAVHSGAKVGPAGEVCLYQLHRSVVHIPNPTYRITKEELAATLGTDYEHTRNCVRLGMRVARWHVHRCSFHYRNDSQWFFAEYHHPSVKCNAYVSAMSRDRGRSYGKLLAKLPKE